MECGGVGGAAAGGAAPAAGSSAGHQQGASAGAVTSGSEGAAAGSDMSAKDVSDAGDNVGSTYNMTQIQNNSVYANMSTQDAVQLHSCVHEPPQTCELDLQKLIEMMMAIKLLQAMNEGQNSGGFSTTC